MTPTDQPRCLNCGKTGEDAFPLGRPRADGSRHPMAYCSDCLSRSKETGVPLRHGGHEAAIRRTHEYRRRNRAA